MSTNMDMNVLKTEVLRLQNLLEVAEAASAAKKAKKPDAVDDDPKTFVDVMQVWYRLLEHMPLEGRCPCVNADDATFCARKPDTKSAPITINGVKYFLCASYETHAMYKHPQKYNKAKAIAINKAMAKKKDKEARVEAREAIPEMSITTFAASAATSSAASGATSRV